MAIYKINPMSDSKMLQLLDVVDYGKLISLLGDN
jgi:hypothetical protein